ncbi:MAG: c-type cytochrome [Saprospiraceae bacterium]|nr:c-type cytochrome [Saprospiraceae bacterium]
MKYKSLIFKFLILLFTMGSTAMWAQDVDLAEGETLFKNNCASCHNKTMKQDMTGPALAGYAERWADYPAEDLYSWIRNSQALIQAGHPRAAELWSQWGPTVMTSFPGLTDAQINNILAYVNVQADKGPVGPVAGPLVIAEESDNTLMYVLLVGILAILAVVLARIISNLNYLNEAAAGGTPAPRKTLVQILTSKGVIAVVLFAAVVIGGFMTVNNAINLGRQQGYMPDQPIKFSHATHAGTHKIDCQYCHDGARRSKHSVIPAANTCMNCHAAIKVGSTYGTGELTKIYASVGWDPNTGTYLEDYDKMATDEIEAIYKKWMEASYVEANGNMDDTGEELVENQWNDLVTSLTNPTKTDFRGPIEWVKIHNLPDHVYFNHAQHVSVGKVACQTCHGPVEKMAVVEQFSPLSMGWCVNCHRQTEVQFAGNEYYETYETYHEEMANGVRTGVTVEEIGGLECQKCHY